MEGKTTLTEFRKMNSVKKKRIVRKNMWCWVFMLPTLLLYILFQGYPIITSAWYSMLDWSGMTMNATFVGLQNFKELLADPLFKNSVVNSFKYMIFSVPIQFILSLVIAYILTSIIHYPKRRYRISYYVLYSGYYHGVYCRNYYDFYFWRNRTNQSGACSFGN